MPERARERARESRGAKERGRVWESPSESERVKKTRKSFRESQRQYEVLCERIYDLKYNLIFEGIDGG